MHAAGHEPDNRLKHVLIAVQISIAFFFFYEFRAAAPPVQTWLAGIWLSIAEGLSLANTGHELLSSIVTCSSKLCVPSGPT